MKKISLALIVLALTQLAKAQTDSSKINLLDEGLLHRQRRCSKRLRRSLREQNVHRAAFLRLAAFVLRWALMVFLRNAATSAPFLKGP